MSYLDRLNPEQLAAATSTHRRVAVIAGAGTGKTATLTARIAHLIHKGASPDRILALTFTNKAALEMRQRVAAAVGADVGSRVHIGTFHAQGIRWIRRFLPLAPGLRLSPRFNVLDEVDSGLLLEEVRKSVCKDLSMRKLRTHRVAWHECLEVNHIDRDQPWFLAWREYHRSALSADCLDFDGILETVDMLISRYPEIARRHAERFEHVLVDEFQDTSIFQLDLVQRMFRWQASLDSSAFVVGDLRQLIYSWRGADVEGIAEAIDGGDWQVYALVRNYRSSRPIVDAANGLQRTMTIPLPEGSELVTDRPGPAITVERCANPPDEADLVARTVREILDSGATTEDVAVLARRHDDLRLVARALDRAEVPWYHVGGDSAVWDDPTARKIVHALRLAANHYDGRAWTMIANWPRERFNRLALAELDRDSMRQRLPVVDLAIGRPEGADLGAFVGRVDGESGLAQAVADLFSSVACAGDEATERARAAISDWDQQYGPATVRDFLDWFSVRHQADGVRADLGRVVLSTVHGAKGLEWETVIVVGLDEGRFPIAREGGNGEEEKRLAYVAVTRARQELILTWAASKRDRKGNTNPTRPSPFLAAMSL